MDNLSHTIIGFGAGELLHRSLPAEADPPRQQVRHRLLLVACALASNFPDLDLVLSRLLPDPLGYLLNHRGHTHTLLFAVPQALLLAALLYLLWPSARTLLRTSASARVGLAASIVIGLALHLLMDFTNSYGLHPFYPFDGRWLYGDMVFIVEPLFWVAIGVPMALIMRWRGVRIAALALLGLALAGFAVTGYLGAASLAGLLLIGLVCGAVQRRDGARGRTGLALAMAISVGFIAVQGLASHLGRQQISAVLQGIDPASTVLDVAMTAFPSQPLCWSYVSVERNAAAGSYRLRRGVASIAPGWLAPLACPAGLVEILPPVALDARGAVVQFGTTTAGLAMLRQWQASDCRADAWLRFARAPALLPDTLPDALSDYRFAATPRGNFSNLPLVGGRHDCPGIPGWGYPRADLLH